MIIPFKYLVQMLIQFIVLQHPKVFKYCKQIIWYLYFKKILQFLLSAIKGLKAKTFSWYWVFYIKKNTFHCNGIQHNSYNTYFNLEIALLWANMLVTPPPKKKKNLRKNVWKGGLGWILQPSLQCKKNPMKSLLYWVEALNFSLSLKKKYIYTHLYMHKWHLRDIVHFL